ncbi:cobalt transporter subunit CbtA [Tistlia consotensis]|uniref:Cobalt transporter subunit CbtA n=1 Tax=Tistlia consotensis USBA 355 TaxID=560819 RepID=A0A1Y6B261_9PROT|nr:CbtA family protein [Tistlia consotensis]SME87836.1 cobalt transporter subunit CbtA [Tistlia consotensis USBA 355]SNR24187.1 cobalt transporter subunit CbtA [Tistlia consotensis]
MLRRLFLTALAAGAIAGVLITAVQSVTTAPIIRHAELYESGELPAHAGLAEPSSRSLLAGLAEVLLPEALAHGTEAHDGSAADDHGGAWAPADGLERTAYSLLANLLLGVGFALLISAGFVLHGREVTPLGGVLWGAAGFVVVTLAPGLGLPPEVPGSFAADLQDRQLWWAAAALCAAAGLGLLAFGRGWPAKALGVVVAALPHAVGAPQPETLGGAVPPELAGHFAAASIVVSAIFWSLLGWLSSVFYRRFD